MPTKSLCPPASKQSPKCEPRPGIGIACTLGPYTSRDRNALLRSLPESCDFEFANLTTRGVSVPGSSEEPWSAAIAASASDLRAYLGQGAVSQGTAEPVSPPGCCQRGQAAPNESILALPALLLATLLVEGGLLNVAVRSEEL